MGIYAILALGLNLKFGYTGLLDIGHVAFYLVGAYVTALLVLPPASEQAFASYILGLNWPWLPAIAVGTLAAGVVGMLVALPAIRLREDYLAIAVLGISVILQRIVQTEGWLANGPGSLRGFDQPFRTQFPLPGDTLAAAALFGFVVFVLWTGATYALARVDTGRESGGRESEFADSDSRPPAEVRSDGGDRSDSGVRPDGGVTAGRTISGPGMRGKIVDSLLALTTLGIGYGAARSARTPTGETERRALLGVGALFGLAAGIVAWLAFEWWLGLVVLAAALAVFYGVRERHVPTAGAITATVAFVAMLLTGGSSTVLLVFLGAISLFTWVFGGVAVVRRYSDLSAREFAIALGLAVAFVAAFLPLIVLGGGGGDESSSIGLLLTLGLLGAFLYGIYYLGVNWSRDSPENAGGGGDGGSVTARSVGSDAAFVRIVGVGALWLFVLRYFGMANVTPFQLGGVSAVAYNTVENLLWLVVFQGGTVTFDAAAFDFARFLLVLTLTSLAVAYYLSELTVDSPFGRVLKAIREDEDVATSLGKNSFGYKVQSMMLGSAMAGFAGGLTAIYYQSLVHTMFVPRVTFVAFLILIIGGTANNRGMILGAVIYWAFQRATADVAGFFPTAMQSSIQALRLAFIGALLIIILYYRPEGLWGEKLAVGGESE